MEPLRREIVSGLVGDPEPLLSSTLPCLPCCILGRSLSPRVFREGPGRWGSFSVYGVKLHLICATNAASISYELTPANVAEVRLTEELLAEANLPGDLASSLFGDLHYRSVALSHAFAECGISLVAERTDQHGPRQRIEIALSSLKRVFELEQTLATTLVVLAANRIAAKIETYTYALLINRVLGRPQGHIKELWAST